jgi:hypothetical protein
MINPGYNKSQFAVDATAQIALQVEPLEKVAKLGYKAIQLFGTFTDIPENFMNLAQHLRGSVAFFETVQFVGRIKELVCLNEKGQTFYEANTWQKFTDRVALAIHSSMKAIRTLAKHGMVDLGRLNANIVGKLTYFSLVTDAFILVSSGFSIWDNILNIKSARKSFFEAEFKVEKWEYRKTLIAQVESGIEPEIKALQAKYERKIEAATEKVLDGQITAQKVAELNLAQQKYTQRLALIKAHDNLGLADELLKADIAYKQKKWSVMKHNATVDYNKAGLGIANSSFKIVVVAFAITLSAANLWANIVLRPFLLGGIVTDSIGINKFFYGHYNKRKPLPAKPVPTAPVV